MAKFMCTHTVPPGTLTREQIEGFAKAGQEDPIIKGYRSFINLSEGKAVCVLEAPDRNSVESWFLKMGMPFDGITQVEFEGDRGAIRSEIGRPETIRIRKPGLAA